MAPTGRRAHSQRWERAMCDDDVECEIEVTPEMIEAGVEKLYEFDITLPIKEEMMAAVTAVFLEMLRCQREYPDRARKR